MNAVQAARTCHSLKTVITLADNGGEGDISVKGVHSMRSVSAILVLSVSAMMLAGCGAMRALTTKHFDFNYAVPAPPPLDSPIGTPAGHPLVVTSSATISDDLVRKFDKYHGGVDWAGLSYQATLSRGSDVSVRLMASLTAPSGSGTDVQTPADAKVIEDFTLTAAQNSITKDETSSSPNAALQSFLNDMLNNSSGDVKVYIYFELSSPTGGRLTVQSIAIKGRAHGSLF